MARSEEGFRGPQVCKLVGITYRQLDYWARTGLLRPSIADANGSGHPAALLLRRRPRAQGDQAAARRRGQPAAGPAGGRVPARGPGRPTWPRRISCWPASRVRAGPLRRGGGRPAAPVARASSTSCRSSGVVDELDAAIVELAAAAQPTAGPDAAARRPARAVGRAASTAQRETHPPGHRSGARR